MTQLKELPIQRLRLYLTATYPCSYLAGQQARSQVAAPGAALDTVTYSELVRMGFRRSGLHVYRPRCDHCTACRSVRVPVASFTPNRSQRRALARNEDLLMRVRPLRFDEAHFRLYRRYQQERHAGGGMDMDDVNQFSAFLLHSEVDSALAEYSLNGEVVMVSLIDRLTDGLSAVYTFYDPDLEKRSLGVFGVLSQIRMARAMNLPYVYLGFWVEGCRKMTYKQSYQPLEMLVDGRWQAFTPASAAEGES